MHGHPFPVSPITLQRPQVQNALDQLLSHRTTFSQIAPKESNGCVCESLGKIMPCKVVLLDVLHPSTRGGEQRKNVQFVRQRIANDLNGRIRQSGLGVTDKGHNVQSSDGREEFNHKVLEDAMFLCIHGHFKLTKRLHGDHLW
ncbi:hypothetical protein PV10_07856 [Exophiala mesophila]|uniref:Uncharacterized protein n=1 Tax=Exophiala mesophila TaxID=212818 RepID=A0A0D1ZUV5_EXOME|nr:uncharacterized protein PV10_07856 [Exophiala mesophila]KIV90568.1 hypothetical protein PV10_07856 [Exophiala mesophila]